MHVFVKFVIYSIWISEKKKNLYIKWLEEKICANIYHFITREMREFNLFYKN